MQDSVANSKDGSYQKILLNNPGRYGSSSNVAQVTLNRYGQVTAVSNVGISGGGGGGSSQWSNVVSETQNNIYFVNNVGVGTSNSPTSNLSVEGNVYVSNAVTTTNIFSTFISCSSFHTGTTGTPPPPPENPIVLDCARSTAVNSMGGDWVAIGNNGTNTVIVYYKGEQFGQQIYYNKSDLFGAFISLSGTGGILAVGAIDEIYIYKRSSNDFELFNKINTSLLTIRSGHVWVPTLNRDGDKFVCSDFFTSSTGGQTVNMFTFNTNSGGTPTMSVDYADSVGSRSYISGDGKYVVIGVIYVTDRQREMFVYNYGNSTPINVIPLQGFNTSYKITTTYNCDTIAVTYTDKVEVYNLNTT